MAVSANQIQPVYSHWKPLSDDEFMLSMTDFREYCRNSIIYDKNGHPVTFELNEAQELVADTILKAIEPILKKQPTPSIRVCIHKSRQMGITTLCLKLEEFIMSKVTHFNALHIMPTEPESDELRDRKLMPMLQATHPDLMPVMISSGNHIDFKEFEGILLDNRLTYGSAGAKGGYHGRMSPVDTPVITPDGWKTIGELKVGDQVFGRDGKPTNIIGVYPQGKKQNYIVKMKNGSQLEAGLEHRWLIKGGNVVTTEEMIKALKQHELILIPTAASIALPSGEEIFSNEGLPEYLQVESINPSREVDSVCIAVDNEDHTYVSGRDFVVSHNTIHALFEDEHAKYLDPFTLEAGILPAMSGNTIRVVLFTAKGMNHSYDLASIAQDPESDWVYLFLPWYLLSEYEMHPAGKYETLKGLSDYDIFLFEEFKRAGVPKNKWQAKAMWYNYTFINEAKRDTKYMYENYPTIAEESFKASGSPIFDTTKIREWEQQPYRKLDAFYRDGKTVFEYTDEGVIREKEPPKRGQTYIIGADPADGEVAGDDSALVVFKLTDDKVSAVCSYNGSISQNDFAELLYDIAMRYNEALIVPERNTGQLMIKWLTEIKGYFNIWTDAQKVSNYNNLGVYTTTATKNEAIARIKFLINNGHYEDFDPRFCEQAKYFTYERTPSGQLRAAAAAGHHDDTVMCRVIATMALDMERFGNYNEMTVKDGRKY